jgi:WD repeat-containing protein 26
MCFREHMAQSNSTHFRFYVHSVANELSDELDDIVTCFEFFNKYGEPRLLFHPCPVSQQGEIGVPSIRYEQKRDSEYELNISTMATFFSAVTATTLQGALSSRPATTIHSIVNTFWFCSLVLSIGAALNSLLKRAT